MTPLASEPARIDGRMVKWLRACGSTTKAGVRRKAVGRCTVPYAGQPGRLLAGRVSVPVDWQGKYGNRLPPPRKGNSTSLGRKGGFVLHVTITAVTLIGVGIAVVGLVQSYQRRQMVYRREALQICEDGLIAALERLQRIPSWRQGMAPTQQGNGTYEVTVRELESDELPRLEVTATGRVGGVVRRQVCTLGLLIEGGDSVWVQRSLSTR